MFRKPFVNALTHADDMVTAWESVDDEFIGVILLYYGALWLGHAVALCGLSRTVLDARKASHGLSVQIKPPTSERRPFITARIETGNDAEAFATINRAFGGESLTGQQVAVKDLLQMIPEMASSLSQIGIESKVTKIMPQWIAGGPTDIELRAMNPAMIAEIATQGELTLEWLRDHAASCGYLQAQGIAVQTGYNGRHVAWRRWREKPDAFSGRDDYAELRAIAIEHDGHFYLMPKIKQKAVAEYAVYLALLYAIGHLARYYPDYWIEMQRERTEEFFLIQEFLDLAEDKVPNLVLNHLSKRTNDFRSP